MLGDAAPPRETPLVLVGRDGRRRVVIAADGAAQLVGLHVGMPATKAQALVKELIIMDAEPDADAAALERLAVWVLRYAPIAASDEPDGLVIEASGASHLHGGEEPMLRDMVERLSSAGIAARAAIATTWGAAHALARFSKRIIFVAPSNDTNVILALPIAALRLDPAIVATLRRLGFNSIGDLAKTPRAPLTLRFGPELLRRVDQAFGSLSEPIEPIRPQEIVEVQRVFGEPIGAPETIARYIGKVVVELCQLLEKRGQGARRLDLLFSRVDNRVETIRIGTAQPARDTKKLTRLLCDKVETIDPGFGIERMRLAATLAEPLQQVQVRSSLIERAEPDVSDLIDTLTNRVGDRRLYRFAPVASDVPERSVSRVAPMAPDAGESWPSHWPRPSRLLPVPEPVETVALLPDHPPVTFTWRGIRHRVKRADGPERVFGEWWKGDAELSTVRDYFQVENEAGERFWLYRAGDGEDAATGSQKWFIHGIFG